jgi:hypothetical protein
MDKSPSFIVNAPAIDYLTISTFDEKNFNLIVSESSSKETQPDDARRMQYHGQYQSMSNGGLFWGTADQKERKHYLIQCSGGYSNRLTNYMMTTGVEDFNVTRLDIQLTLIKPEWFKSRGLVDSLRLGNWPHRTRTVTAIDGGGNDTVYIGSRHSDRFIRIYVKDTDYLRFEVEYKAERANAVYEMLKTYGKERAMLGILHREMISLPTHPIIDGFRSHIHNDGESLKPEVIRTDSNTYKWFIHSVVPALQRLLNDHDQSARVRTILLDIISSTDMQD